MENISGFIDYEIRSANELLETLHNVSDAEDTKAYYEGKLYALRLAKGKVDSWQQRLFTSSQIPKA
jgi:hypothetical protein